MWWSFSVFSILGAAWLLAVFYLPMPRTRALLARVLTAVARFAARYFERHEDGALADGIRDVAERIAVRVLRRSGGAAPAVRLALADAPQPWSLQAYVLRALASVGAGVPLGRQLVAQRTGLDLAVVDRLAADLARKGWVDSSPGAGGADAAASPVVCLQSHGGRVLTLPRSSWEALGLGASADLIACEAEGAGGFLALMSRETHAALSEPLGVTPETPSDAAGLPPVLGRASSSADAVADFRAAGAAFERARQGDPPTKRERRPQAAGEDDAAPVGTTERASRREARPADAEGDETVFLDRVPQRSGVNASGGISVAKKGAA